MEFLAQCGRVELDDTTDCRNPTGMIEHVSRAAITFSFNGKRIVIGGELFLDPPGDWANGFFEVSSGSMIAWQSGEIVTLEEREAILCELIAAVGKTGQLRRIEIA